MRDNKCLLCGKDTGHGRKGNPKKKYHGGWVHYYPCYEQMLLSKSKSKERNDTIPCKALSEACINFHHTRIKESLCIVP